MTARPQPESEVRVPVPWEDLLRTEDSLLASVAAAGLDGLRGTLHAALTAAPTDRGAGACTTLLEALDRLLAETGHAESVHAGFSEAGTPGVGGSRYGAPRGEGPAYGARQAEIPHLGSPAGTPHGEVPQHGAPQTVAPLFGTPPAGIPPAGSPAGTPQAAVPQYGTPQTEAPPYGTPKPEAPRYDSPHAGIPQAGSPPAEYPPAGSPQTPSPQTGGDPTRPTAPHVPPRPAAPPRAAAPAILALAAELAGSPEVDDFAPGAVPPAPGGPGGTDGVRRWYHLTLLRLPDRHAGVWRTRAAEADPVARESWETLRGWADEVLLPPSGDGRPGLRTERDKVTEPSDLAKLVLALHRHDEALCLLLDRLWTGGSTRLADPHVSQAYRTELAKRLQALERSPRDSTEQLRASVAVDEALCSVTHLPPSAPGSWWNRLAEESHTAALDLCRHLLAAGRNVEAVLPARPYRQARHHTRATDDIRLGVGGRPGDTLACLRLWLRVDDQVFPGRVVHRGQE